jgi:UMP-CMP kinase
LSKEFNLVHLSAGELLRQERLSGSENGLLIDSYLKEGRIVPVELSLSLLDEYMHKHQQHRYLIDGFPRNHDNLQGWNKHMYNKYNIEDIIYIDCTEDILEKRLLSRGLTSNRNDDHIDVIKKRFITFANETLPVIRHITSSSNGISTSDTINSDSTYPYSVLDGRGSKEEVYKQFKEVFVELLRKELMHKHQQIINNVIIDNSLDANEKIEGQVYTQSRLCRNSLYIYNVL